MSCTLKLFLAALTDAGFPVLSVAAIREQHDPLPIGLAELLLDWIPRLDENPLQESVAWTLLAARKGTLNGSKLCQLFDSTIDDDVKRALASVILQTRPRNIEPWLLTSVGNRHSAAIQNLLASALAMMVSANEAVPVLLQVFEKAPLAVVHPLGKIGTRDVREVLASRLPTATGPLRREIRQAVKRIDRRLSKA